MDRETRWLLARRNVTNAWLSRPPLPERYLIRRLHHFCTVAMGVTSRSVRARKRGRKRAEMEGRTARERERLGRDGDLRKKGEGGRGEVRLGHSEAATDRERDTDKTD